MCHCLLVWNIPLLLVPVTYGFLCLAFLTHASSIMVTLVTFGIYFLIEEKSLTPENVFSGLALFNQLTVPLFIFPITVPIIISAMVSPYDNPQYNGFLFYVVFIYSCSPRYITQRLWSLELHFIHHCHPLRTCLYLHFMPFLSISQGVCPTTSLISILWNIFWLLFALRVCTEVAGWM